MKQPCPNCGGYIGEIRSRGDGHQEQQSDGHLWFEGFSGSDGTCLYCAELGITPPPERCRTCQGEGLIEV